MRHFLMIFFFLIVVSAPVSADEIHAESTIKAATVYSDRATVTRNAEIKIPKGSHNLVFEGLPFALDAGSLRVSGSSEAEVILGAVTHKVDTSEDYVEPRVQELKAKYEDVKKTIQIQAAERAALKQANDLLMAWGNQAGLSDDEKPAKIHLDHEKWVSASDGLSKKMLSNLKEIINVELKIDAGNKKIRKIQADLRQLRAKHKRSYTVTIPFEASKASTLNIALSYQITGVSWRPIYDARLDVESKTLKLVQYGSVSQQTGEDWEDIKLTLSTARPSRGAQLPGLSSRWLSIYVPPPRTKKSSKDSFSFDDEAFEFEKSTAQLAAEYGGSIIPAPVTSIPKAPSSPHTRLEFPEIGLEVLTRKKADALPGETEDPLHRWRLLQEERVERQMKSREALPEPIADAFGYVGEYRIPGPSTVKPDGSEAKLLIAEHEPETELEVQIKPQFSTDAFLVSKIKLKGDTPLLPGLINLFRDGAFIGQVQIVNMIRPNEDAEISFGIDDGVIVKRNMLKDQSSESGLISKDSVVEKRYITEIQNLHKDTIKIVVSEIIPASKDQLIRVEILPETTGGYQTDLKNVKGTINWVGSLEPQQKTSINLGWKVSWPKAKTINGLYQFR